MKSTLCSLYIVALIGLATSVGAADKAPVSFNFDADTLGAPPKGFEFGLTGQGSPGEWVVRAEKDAPSGGNVLAQTDTDDIDYRFPVAYTGPDMKDLHLSAKCKAVSGEVDQAFGLVFRLKDADNYYVTRANPLEDNIRLYHVVKGNRRQIADWKGKVTAGMWHELAVEALGDHLQVFFDGTKIIDTHDNTFSEAGKFGVWTKADSFTLFDDLAATAK